MADACGKASDIGFTRYDTLPLPKKFTLQGGLHITIVLQVVGHAQEKVRDADLAPQWLGERFDPDREGATRSQEELIQRGHRVSLAPTEREVNEAHGLTGRSTDLDSPR